MHGLITRNTQLEGARVVRSGRRERRRSSAAGKRFHRRLLFMSVGQRARWPPPRGFRERDTRRHPTVPPPLHSPRSHTRAPENRILLFSRCSRRSCADDGRHDLRKRSVYVDGVVTPRVYLYKVPATRSEPSHPHRRRSSPNETIYGCKTAPNTCCSRNTR